MTAMEEHRDELPVLVVGFRLEMETLFHLNPGLHSHVGHHVDFPDFDHDKLMAIAERLCAEANHVMDDGAKAAFDE
ncbi:MAG: hypothetical protein ACP5PJ_04220 [Acidimicrobiales bacterium]